MKPGGHFKDITTWQTRNSEEEGSLLRDYMHISLNIYIYIYILKKHFLYSIDREAFVPTLPFLTHSLSTVEIWVERFSRSRQTGSWRSERSKNTNLTTVRTSYGKLEFVSEHVLFTVCVMCCECGRR